MTKTISIALAAIALFTTPVLAETRPAPARAHVSAAGLDLDSASGVRALDLRIVRVARELCGEASNLDLAGQNEARRCVANAVAAVSDDRARLIATAARTSRLAAIPTR